MATRGTREEAEALAIKLRRQYPQADIRVDDISKWYQFKIKLDKAREQGLDILGEPDANGYVQTQEWMPKFDVYEVRICRNGHERRTIAFGEDSPCPECLKAQPDRRAQQTSLGPDFEWDTRDQGGEFAGWRNDKPR